MGDLIIDIFAGTLLGAVILLVLIELIEAAINEIVEK